MPPPLGHRRLPDRQTLLQCRDGEPCRLVLDCRVTKAVHTPPLAAKPWEVWRWSLLIAACSSILEARSTTLPHWTAATHCPAACSLKTADNPAWQLRCSLCDRQTASWGGTMASHTDDDVPGTRVVLAWRLPSAVASVFYSVSARVCQLSVRSACSHARTHNSLFSRWL